ncbi:hypothetical protein SEUCBS139899_007657 [Sporothrix eucalyptigena]
MEIVWQASETAARKRTCRIRKKRCFHTAADKAERVSKASAQPPISIVVDTSNSTIDVSSGITTRDSSPKPGRSIDYIPEIALHNLSDGQQEQEHNDDTVSGNEAPANACSKCSPAASKGNDKHSPPHPTKRRQSDVKRAQRQLAQFYRKHRPRNAPVILSDAHRRYLEEAGALLELPRTTADALLAIYVSLLDDLIPILDGASVFRSYSNGHTSIYLIRAICLVSCKTKQAAPFLRLHEDGPLLAPLDFASKLLAGLDAAIKADLEADRITKVQILALMHLHNDGTTGTRRAASCLAQAVSEAWSLSMHWQIPGNVEQQQQPCDFLWWSLRNFDRLSKPIMAAAPFVINDSDVGLRRITAKKDNYRSQIMALATALGDLLETATSIFKATCKATVDACQSFPTFEEVTVGAKVDLDLFHRSHRAYLEIWYCVAAMLSCRYSGPGSAPYQRRFNAAMRVLDLITDGKHESLPPLPLVPYAMSMSTTIVYRALRDKQIDSMTAQRDMALCCEALDGMARLWTSVAGVAKLARRLLRLLGRPETSDNGTEQPRQVPQLAVETSQLQQLAEVAELQSTVSNTSSTSTIVPPTTWQAYPDLTHYVPNGPPTMDFETQLSADWDASPGTYPQFDAAFHDLFDFAMPTGFREHEAWAFFPTTCTTNCDGSSTASEFPVGPVDASQLY